MNPELDAVRTPDPQASRVMCPDSLGRALLAMAVPPTQRRDSVLERVPVLGRRAELPEGPRHEALVSDAIGDAVPVPQVAHIDAEAVAEWIVAHYPAATYPAVVLGATHGATVHLAAACDAPWLPTSFTVTVPWPDGTPGDWVAAMRWGARLAERMLARNPSVSVRQVHDPAQRGTLCGATVSLHVRWRALPRAYHEFLRSRLAAGGSTVLVRDLRTWPVLPGSPGYSFQVGSPTTGDPSSRGLTVPVEGAVTRYAETSGEPGFGLEVHQIAAETGRSSHRVFFTDAQALSAGVADLHRTWLRPLTGALRCVVGVGRMVDPWVTAAGGMVPYWCESPSRSVTDAAQMWLAGSEPFDTISVLPEAPGAADDDTATMTDWRTIAGFAERAGRIDRVLASRYPLLPASPSNATRFLSASVPSTAPRPAPMSAREAVRRLKGNGTVRGLLVT